MSANHVAPGRVRRVLLMFGVIAMAVLLGTSCGGGADDAAGVDGEEVAGQDTTGGEPLPGTEGDNEASEPAPSAGDESAWLCYHQFSDLRRAMEGYLNERYLSDEPDLSYPSSQEELLAGGHLEERIVYFDISEPRANGDPKAELTPEGAAAGCPEIPELPEGDDPLCDEGELFCSPPVP